MKVLVTGGGVAGAAVTDELLARGHEVRLLSPKAATLAKQWPERVEPWPGSVDEPSRVLGAAEGCDAVVHTAHISLERPPRATFERVNVGGTVRVVEEARRAGVKRLVVLSSLGVPGGWSPYHRAQRRAEEAAKAFPGVVVVRAGNVYGPGDEAISLLVAEVRSLPVVPLVGTGDRPLRPLWGGDLGRALAGAALNEGVEGRLFEISGPEAMTLRELFDRVAELTGRKPLRLQMPRPIASAGIGILRAVGFDLPFDPALAQTLEERGEREGQRADLEELSGHPATPLDEGLRRLIDALPEQLPEHGVGQLRQKRTWADVEGSGLSPEALIERVRTHFNDVMPVQVGVEGVLSDDTLDVGESVSLGLPGRGHVQMRCERIEPTRITLATVVGHFLAGAVEISASPAKGRGIRIEVRVCERPATRAELVGMRLVGDFIQSFHWAEVVRRCVDLSGGKLRGRVHQKSEAIRGAAARRFERDVRELVLERRRHEHEEGGPGAPLPTGT